MNLNKSQAVWLGSKKINEDKPFNIKWPEKPIKALGVYFSYDKDATQKSNFKSKSRS